MCQRDCVPWTANVEEVKWGISLSSLLNNFSDREAVSWRSGNLLWPDPIWTDSSLVPQSSVPVLSKRKTWPTMSQSIRDLKFGYSLQLMKPAPYPRHTTSGPRPKKTAVFIMREWRHPNVRTCHARRQLRLAVRDGEPAIFPPFQSRLQPMDIIAIWLMSFPALLSTRAYKHKERNNIIFLSCFYFIY